MSSSILGVRLHPTEVELINFLKRFLKGELLQCPIKLAEIYGDQPPWAIFKAEDKIEYFITPMRKLKGSDERHCRTCANGTWRGQTLEEDCQIQQAPRDVVDDMIGSNDFWEAMNGVLKYVTVNIPDDLWQLDDQSPLQLIMNENI